MRLFYPNTTTLGEGLHRVTLSIGSLGDTKKASIKTPNRFKSSKSKSEAVTTVVLADVTRSIQIFYGVGALTSNSLKLVRATKDRLSAIALCTLISDIASLSFQAVETSWNPTLDKRSRNRP